MNSQIELYPHNQIAYDKLCDMLSQSDRACVIQPTGTGKFVIIAKLVQDNPDKRFLLLGTNDYMFIDQMDNLEKIAPGFHPDNLQFKTYSAAMVHARSEHATLQYDYIILDEFHHCGAPEWSKGVQWFIDGSPDAKLLGFSATPIRFSDDGRDMADEIFEGNIASSMQLEEAWLRGILPIPKYVIALYDAPKELGELKVSIEKVKGISESGIHSALKRESHYTAGYHFMSCSEYNTLSKEEVKDVLKTGSSKIEIAVRCIETGVEYPSIRAAERDSGVSATSIRLVAKGDRTKAGGFTWEYVDGAPKKCGHKGGNHPSARKVRCVETGRLFTSLGDAARTLGLKSGNSIKRAIDRCGTSGGYHWEYVDD